MRRILEVREFDKISCNPEYKTEYAYLPEADFREVLEFIHSFAGDEEHADALEFMKIGFRRHVGEIISVNNYVGLIETHSGCQIQILPKIDFGNDSDTGNGETKRVFLRMLRCMKDFPSKIFNESNLLIDRMPLYEIFINMYLQEVRTLVKHGLKSGYIEVEDNLNYYKGKLLVNEHIKRNVVHAERFYVQYDNYMVDRAENRLIKATLIKLQCMTESAENQKRIRQLLNSFEMVQTPVHYEKEFSRVIIDRNTKDYDMLMRWSKIFLLNKSFSTFAGGNNAKALLFPMEQVFEAYVAKQLKNALTDLNWDISTQDRGYYLFDSPRQFALRPDIVVRRTNGTRVILDTKWKNLIDNARANYGISQADMYQMYAYAKKYGTSEIWLLYPMNAEMRGHKRISFVSDDHVHVQLFFVDVAHIEESMEYLRHELMLDVQ